MLGLSYLEHDDCVAADDDHADANFFSSGFLFERVVEDNVKVDLCC